MSAFTMLVYFPLRPAGRGQHTKMMNQILIASNMIGVVESLLYASKAGLNLGMVDYCNICMHACMHVGICSQPRGLQI